jgi:hypothetical protein
MVARVLPAVWHGGQSAAGSVAWWPECSHALLRHWLRCCATCGIAAAVTLLERCYVSGPQPAVLCLCPAATTCCHTLLHLHLQVCAPLPCGSHYHQRMMHTLLLAAGLPACCRLTCLLQAYLLAAGLPAPDMSHAFTLVLTSVHHHMHPSSHHMHPSSYHMHPSSHHMHPSSHHAQPKTCEAARPGTMACMRESERPRCLSSCQP